jgi:hypothetical protein
MDPAAVVVSGGEVLVEADGPVEVGEPPLSKACS